VQLRLGPSISRLKPRRWKWLGAARIGDGVGGKRKELTVGAHMAVTGEKKGITTGMHKPKEKTHFGEYAKVSRADWAEWGGGGQRGKAGRRGRVGPVGPDPRRGFKWKLIFEFQINLDFGKPLRNSIKRFRRNLDMRIFPKFF
jgi:hypothetical protein